MSNLPPDLDPDRKTMVGGSRKRDTEPEEKRVSLLQSMYASQSAPYKTFLGSAQRHHQDRTQGGAVPMSHSATAYQPSGLAGAGIPWSATYASPTQTTQTSGFQGNPYQPVAVTSTQYPQHMFYNPDTRTIADARPISSTSVGGQSSGSARIKVEPGSTMTSGGRGPTADTNQYSGTPASGSVQFGGGFAGGATNHTHQWGSSEWPRP